MPARLLTAKAIRRIVYVTTLAVLAVSAVQAYQDLLAARRRSAELSQRIVAVETEIERLERANETLEADAETVERVARQQLGLVREGEVVLMLPEAEGDGSDEGDG